ncbi:MAG TPA: chemotaxis protein CheW [Gammaproteobacteria bacterium]|nr:chemotaxis protein CheW [Gammaproteobacteria bacterium]
MVDTTYSGPDLDEGVAQSGRADVINCLLIPIRNEQILLPNTAIAEVISWQKPEPTQDGPEWFLGMMNWRDYRVPVISFEAAIGGQVAPPSPRSRIVVLNTLNGNTNLPYIGLLSQGIPHLQVVGINAVMPNNDITVPSPTVASYALLGNQPVMVPNIDDLESRLLRLLSN